MNVLMKKVVALRAVESTDGMMLGSLPSTSILLIKLKESIELYTILAQTTSDD
jgi:hypothetical protein